MATYRLVFIGILSKITIVLPVYLILVLFNLILGPTLLLILVILPHQQIVVTYLHLWFILGIVLISLNLRLNIAILRLRIGIWVPIWLQNTLLKLHILLLLWLIIFVTWLFILADNIKRLKRRIDSFFSWRVISLQKLLLLLVSLIWREV